MKLIQVIERLLVRINDALIVHSFYLLEDSIITYEVLSYAI